MRGREKQTNEKLAFIIIIYYDDARLAARRRGKPGLNPRKCLPDKWMK
jgi:hypothetical protein